MITPRKPCGKSQHKISNQQNITSGSLVASYFPCSWSAALTSQTLYLKFIKKKNLIGICFRSNSYLNVYNVLLLLIFLNKICLNQYIYPTNTITPTEQTNENTNPVNIKLCKILNICFYLLSVIYVRVSFNITNIIYVTGKATNNT